MAEAPNSYETPVSMRGVVHSKLKPLYLRGMQHLLNFLPLPHGHGSLRPTLSCFRRDLFAKRFATFSGRNVNDLFDLALNLERDVVADSFHRREDRVDQCF